VINANLSQIGKTSSLVLTLSGVLKDILLVFASMFLFSDPVTLLQAFGYGIALMGLIFYKLGGEKLREYFGQGGMKWAEFGQTRPAARKLVIFGLVMAAMFMVLVGLAPKLAPESTAKFTGIGTYIAPKQ
jgi:multidrug transporter EmrE-like cation transporter